MKQGRYVHNPGGIPGRILLTGLAAFVISTLPPTLAAKSAGSATESKRYIVELRDPPLAAYDGRELSVRAKSGIQRLAATRPPRGRGLRLDVRSETSRAYLDFLQARHEALEQEAAALLGRDVEPVHRYRMATNGMALDLTEADAKRLSRSPLVKRIVPDRVHRLHTYGGPKWIGAAQIWNGEDMLPQRQGENIVIGVIDSGINWEHPSFANPSGGYSHSNPLGDELGLCADGTVECNGKIIGIYDFVEDNPNTEDIVEENTNGRDNSGHGSHVTSIAAGNRVNVNLGGGLTVALSGVAPRANIVSYRTCYIGDPPDPEGGGCQVSALLKAIDQAVTDGVDVINYSIGSDAFDPWLNPIAQAFLNARDAGIFVATSAGNAGPEPGTIGSPADAPWIVAVGNATHNQLPALPFDLEGGPSNLACVEGDGPEITSSTGLLPVIFAGDVGDPLGCSAFPAGSLDGAIALVQRGDCTFALKADNAAAAGAELMVIVNNITGPPVNMGGLEDSTVKSCAVSKSQGEAARNFVQAAPNPRGRLNYPLEILANDSSGDILDASSSRGPAPEPVQNTLKPNLIAPGTRILAAIHEDPDFEFLNGTSMSSPHVAGAGALLLSVHEDWGPSEIASALETTATAELAIDHGGSQATPLKVGAGRPQLGEAAAVGLYLEETTENFLAANPAEGGDPVTLNLPGLVQSSCTVRCSFSRRVTDLVGGASWTATPLDFSAGVEATVSPAGFALGSGASQELTIDVDLESAADLEEWYFGRIRLSSDGLPDQFLTVAVYADSGELPSEWAVSDSRDGGWVELALSDLAAIPEATYTAGGLAKQRETVEILKMDPTRDDPYDSEEGTLTEWHELPDGGMLLYAEVTQSTATDIDLYVGRDDNGNGRADQSEELCSSTTPDVFERCDLNHATPGNYWILVQNWEGDIVDGNEVTLLNAGVGPAGAGNLSASGPSIVPALESFPVRLSWDNLQAAPGEVWLGAVGVGTKSSAPNNLGVILLRFTRTAVADPATFPLVPGTEHGLALAAGGQQDRLFIDVPPGTSRLDVFTQGATAEQSDDLVLELKRLDFGPALADPPFAVAPTSAPVQVSAEGSGGVGPSITVIGVQSGRWYAVLRNTGSQALSATIRAELHFDGQPIVPRPGLWEPSSRPGLRQGIEFNHVGPNGALLWYTYDEANQPTWYLANAPVAEGNVWSADLLRFTNDGEKQQYVKVGQVVVTALAEDDVLFSYTLFGLSGTDRMQPTSSLTCPGVGGQEQSYTGLWDRGTAGVGGASILVNADAQGQVHYLYDTWGEPRWLLANDLVDPAPTNSDIPLLQFYGYCAVCDESDVGFLQEPVGLLTRSFSSEQEGSWTLDYLFEPPLSGSAQRAEGISKLTDRMDCQ